MKWKILPENKQWTTGLPLTLELTAWHGKAKANLISIGELELKEKNNVLTANFYTKLPGNYQLEIKDDQSKAVIQIPIKEYQFLDFPAEFGFFLCLFLIVMGGVVLWTKWIMKKSMP